uniref:Uncharacterized protein n=1 Tax=Meloidogyne javanica TaxID=6303 RepID=A0A915MWU3_MELJA
MVKLFGKRKKLSGIKKAQFDFKRKLHRLGCNNKDFVGLHCKQEHQNQDKSVYDNRWRHLVQIKEVIKVCFRDLYKEPARVPTVGDILELKRAHFDTMSKLLEEDKNKIVARA